MRAFVSVDAPSVSLPGRSSPVSAPSHITLRFFADLSPEIVEKVVSAIHEAAGATAPFELSLEGFGAFPDSRRPRVVFAEVARGRAELVALGTSLDRALEKRGVPPDSRPFAPHLTLFRVRGVRDLARAREVLAAPREAELGRSRVKELCLKESLLGPHGASHAIVASAQLQGHADSL